MSVWKRGFLAVVRKPIRSLLLVLLIYCMTALVVIGISASHTSIQAQLEAKNNVGAYFQLSLSMEDYYNRIEQLEAEGYNLTVIPKPPASQIELQAPPNFQFISLFLNDIEKLAQVEGIEDYNVESLMNLYMKAIDFERVEGSFSNREDVPEVTIRGVREMSFLPSVQDGSITLIQGRWIKSNDHNALVISEELAELNQLQLGDTLTLETVAMKDLLMLEVMERQGFEQPEPVQIQGEIVGIFKNNRSIAFNPGIVAQQSENQIFSNLDFAKVGIHEADPFYETATFHVANVDQFEEVKARLEAVDINWLRYELFEMNEAVQALSPAFTQVRDVGSFLLGVVVVASFGILALVFVFLIKGRTQEIGIWLALGHSKAVIVFQMFYEAFLMVLMALLLCTATISFIVSGAESYFNRQVVTQTGFENDFLEEESFVVPEVVGEPERIALIVSPETMVMTAGLSMVLIVVAIVLAMMPVLRLKPREIFGKLF